jgi:hypothetical protein
VADLTREQKCAEAQLRVRRALDHIQRAQEEIGRASAELSSLIGGIPVWKAAGKLYDQVHRFWYRVEAFRQAGRFTLDDVSSAALAKRLEQAHLPQDPRD